MKESYFVEITLPRVSLKQRDLFTQLLLRIASAFSFQGLEDWTVDLSKSQKILGAAEEFHDLTKSAKVNNTIRAHFGKKKDAVVVMGLLSKVFEGLKFSRPKKLAKKDWMKEWRKHYKIQLIEQGKEKIYIVPAWMKAPKNFISVRIHPGQAFGTGTHATTRLCLKSFLSVAPQMPKKMKILDFGAGTGILAMSADKWAKHHGAKTEILAVESDPQALLQGKKNAKMNRVKMKSVAKLKQQKFDFIFANVLSPVLLDQRKHLIAAMKEGGYLVLSGLLKRELKDFLQKFHLERSAKIELIAKNTDKEWASLLFFKHHNHSRKHQ